jgi:hypothetical protein
MNDDEKEKFMLWLCLHLKKSTAKDRSRTIKRLLIEFNTLHYIIKHQSENDLLDYVEKHIISHNFRLNALHITKPSYNNNNDDDQFDNDRFRTVSTMDNPETFFTIHTQRSNTIAMKIEALSWYCLYNNKQYPKLNILKQRVQNESRHIEQSDIISHLFSPSPLLFRYNNILKGLKQCQFTIESIFIEYFTYKSMRNVFDDTDNYRHQGKFKKNALYNYIQPFLYLSFLLCERPVDHLTLLRFKRFEHQSQIDLSLMNQMKNTEQKKQFVNKIQEKRQNNVEYTLLTRDEIHALQGTKKIKAFISCEENCTDAKWFNLKRLYVDKDGNIIICFLVGSKNIQQRIYRIQTYTIPNPLGWYFYVYATIRSHISSTSLKVFSGPRNGLWKTQVKDTCVFVKNNLTPINSNIPYFLLINQEMSFQHQFLRNIKELWFIVNMITEKQQKQNVSIRTLRKTYLDARDIHIYGNKGNLGFVTSAGLSTYYMGPVWIQSIVESQTWWSKLFNLQHDPIISIPIVHTLTPLNNHLHDMYTVWFKNWKRIYS